MPIGICNKKITNLSTLRLSKPVQDSNITAESWVLSLDLVKWIAFRGKKTKTRRHTLRCRKDVTQEKCIYTQELI